jgi:predicted O-methyltransferase YrrM
MLSIHSFLPLARIIYARLIAPYGKYRLHQILKEDFPYAFHMPLQYLFSKEISAEDKRVVDRIEAIRAIVANRTDLFEVTFPGTGKSTRTASQIAYRSSVTPDWGTFLYLCAKSFMAGTILELGSCAGISGCYLASSPYCTKFITIEGSPSLALLAAANIHQISGHAVVINALFDDVLNDILPSITSGIDLAYIDGHHDYEATRYYFQRLVPYLRKGALVVFDDIHWSKAMWEAWKTMREWRGFAYTIDVGRFGVGLWDESAPRPKAYSLSLYTGWVRKFPRTNLHAWQGGTPSSSH